MSDFPQWLVLAVVAPFLGSFLGVLVKRMPTGRPIVLGRSMCESCNSVLTFGDLIPILSWLKSRAQCRRCSVRLGLFYPAIELAALGVVLWAAFVTPDWILPISCIFGWTLLTLAVIDWETLLLPDSIVLFLFLFGIATSWLIDPTQLETHIGAAVIGGGVLVAIAKTYRYFRGRNGMGLGDAKLVGALGVWVSWDGLVSILFIGCATALLSVLMRCLIRRTPRRDEPIPFGTFLAASGWIVWLYGPLAFQ